MFILMHCGGIPFNGDTIKTRSLGGSESAAYYMARELASLGHKVTLFTNSEETGIYYGVKYEWAGNMSDGAPLGERFTFYAENTPSDVCIVQRHPQAFARKYASKINLLWLHDLALRRNKDAILSQAWNIDGFLTVSEFHKAQVVKEWGLNPDCVYPIRNGVDLSLFEGKKERDPYALVYSSRPERGLMHLVKEGGIMEKLGQIDPRYHLAVCGYDNTTPQMEPLYNYLWDRCEAMPNVKNLGALTKAELAELMMTSGAQLYPTEFEEVSCITAMEAAAAGLPFLSSEFAALPETCKGGGAVLMPMKGEEADEESFIAYLLGAFQGAADGLRKAQEAKRIGYAWSGAALMLMDVVKGIFASASHTSLAHHFIRHSDIAAFSEIPSRMVKGPLGHALIDEASKAYAFYHEDRFAEHYEAYYKYEADRGVNYGPEDVTGTMRFQAVANFVSKMPQGSRVLDYGCAHGHYSVALAKLFPELQITGIDLTASNVEKANKWAAEEKLPNVSFAVGDATESTSFAGEFDLIIAAEVVEHVANPQRLVDNLASMLAEDGRMVITTPYGPWEAMGYTEHKYWRAHLHHFEREDLHDAFGHHEGFGVICVPSGSSKFSSPIGSYVTSFGKPKEASRKIDYARKIRTTMPDQTLAVCMIVKDAENDILRCLKSVVESAQEIVIGIDPATTDNTKAIIESFAARYPLVAWSVFDIKEKVSESGFAAARNKTVAMSSADWVLWIDSDEVLFGTEHLPRLLRNNGFDGYAVKQHHISAEPVGIIKTDLPCRLFRNTKGIQFFGYVHEHPEKALNAGIGHVCLADGIQIMHHGYSTEPVRRKRFSRNIGLLARDRKEMPERTLGKFLWIRDLAQMCQYDIEHGVSNLATFEKRADEGIALWESILESDNVRLCIDALPYYSQLCQFAGKDEFDFGFSVAASKNGNLGFEGAQKVTGTFHSKEAAMRLMNKACGERLNAFDTRYY